MPDNNANYLTVDPGGRIYYTEPGKIPTRLPLRCIKYNVEFPVRDRMQRAQYGRHVVISLYELVLAILLNAGDLTTVE